VICPERRHRLGTSGGGKLREQLVKPGSPGKWPIGH